MVAERWYLASDITFVFNQQDELQQNLPLTPYALRS